MWPFSRHRKAYLPPAVTGQKAFFDWTDEEIAEMSAAIRIHGQPDSEGWQKQARIFLNVLRGGRTEELLARETSICLNPQLDPDDAIEGTHYMEGMPNWCVWLEYARPAVAFYAKKYRGKT